MDDKYDELDIPDDWLELGSKRRNKEPDFVVDKKFRSDTSVNSTATSKEDEVFVPKSDLNGQKGSTDKFNSVAHASVIEEAKSIRIKESEEPAGIREDAWNSTINISSSSLSDPNESVSRASVIDEEKSVKVKDSEEPAGIREDACDSTINISSSSLSDPNESVLHASVIDEEKSVKVKDSEEPAGIREDACDSTINTSSSSLSDPYESSFNEPVFYENSCDQFLPNEKERAEKQTSVVESTSDSSTSNDNQRGDSLNGPDLLSSEVKIQPPVIRDNQGSTFDVSDYSFSSDVHGDSIMIEDNVEKYTEHLSFTDDELSFISSEPGTIITVENDNLQIQSSSKTEVWDGLHGHNDKAGLKKISSLVRDAEIISKIVPDRDFNDIYNTLLDHRDSDNRLDIATAQLLEKTPPSEQTVIIDLFEEVQIVMSAVPKADANIVYTLLEGLPPSTKRVKRVIHHLNPALAGDESPTPKPALKKKESSIEDPHLKNDPIFRDMRTIARIFPETDRNEIYALLEANHDKGNRLQAVIEEIGKLKRDESQEIIIPEEDNIKLSAEGMTH